DMAWDTFFWMATLVMMASELQSLGVVNWATSQVVGHLHGINWMVTLLILVVTYFYTQYFFASTTAHVSSMYGPFLALAIATGAPPLLSALVLAFMSSLFGGLTQFASGPAPILYAQGHVELKKWWKVGLITSIFYLVIWLGSG